MYLLLRDEKVKVQITPLKLRLNKEKDAVIDIRTVLKHQTIMENKAQNPDQEMQVEAEEGKKKKKKKQNEEPSYRVFVELNSYFIRVDDDELATNILLYLFQFDWEKVSLAMKKISELLPKMITKPFF